MKWKNPIKPSIEKDFPQKKGLLNIYFHVSENSGVGYYRQYLPALKLREHGLANVMISDFCTGEAAKSSSLTALKSSLT